MSSTYEPFGQTILEAMSSGLSVIGFKSDDNNVMTATDEIVENGVNGFLCDFGVDSLADSLEKLISLSPKEMEKMKFLNREKVSDHFSWNSFCRSLLEVSR